MSNTIKFPLWLTIITILFFISNLFVFGIFSMVHPKLPFPDAGESATFPIQFFAARHIALAFPLLYGLIKKDVKVLIVMYSIFIVLSTIDIALLLINGYYIPILGDFPVWQKGLIAISAFLLPVGLALRKLLSYKI